MYYFILPNIFNLASLRLQEIHEKKIFEGSCIILCQRQLFILYLNLYMSIHGKYFLRIRFFILIFELCWIYGGMGFCEISSGEDL